MSQVFARQATRMMHPPLDAVSLRGQFPGLGGTANGKPFVYLDSAATTQKPLAVIERMDRFLRSEYGTVHRGLYQRSVASTKAYEDARAAVARFINAHSEREIVFTGGCTDAINLVANAWGRANLKPGDQVLITAMEHHANIVPWQLVCQATGAQLVACPINDDGSLDRDAWQRLLSRQVKLCAFTWISNSLGTVNPVSELCKAARLVGARTLVDAAQAVAHQAVDVRSLGCDFLAFAPHKMYGPTGIGVLYGREDVLNSMPPWRGGGEMIERVTLERSTYAPAPARFEAGTPPIVEAIGLAAACDWLSELDLDRVAASEHALYTYAEQQLATVPGLRRIGTAPVRSGVLAFTMKGAHAADIANVLDLEGVAVRAGHHCAQPVMDRFNVGATARISLGVYTTKADIDQAVAALKTCARLFGGD